MRRPKVRLGLPRLVEKPKTEGKYDPNGMYLRNRCRLGNNEERQRMADEGDGLCLTMEERTKLAKAAKLNEMISQATYGKVLWTLATQSDCHRNPATAERCVLNQVLGARSDERIFAPDALDWTKDPETWLTNEDIEAVMKQYVEQHPNVLMLPYATMDFRKENGQCLNPAMCNFRVAEAIANKIVHVLVLINKDKYEGEGTHWVTLYVNLEEGISFYFDSTGKRPQPEPTKWINQVAVEWNAWAAVNAPDRYPIMKKLQNTRNHQLGGTNCGLYSIFMLTSMIEPTHFMHLDKPDSVLDKIRYFTDSDFLHNGYMQRFRYHYFNIPPSRKKKRPVR